MQSLQKSTSALPSGIAMVFLAYLAVAAVTASIITLLPQEAEAKEGCGCGGKK